MSLNPSLIPMEVFNKLAYDILAISPADLANFGKTSSWASNIVNKIFNTVIEVATRKIPMISQIKDHYAYKQWLQTSLASLCRQGGKIDQAYQKVLATSTAHNRLAGEIAKNPFLQTNAGELERLLQSDVTNASIEHQVCVAMRDSFEKALAGVPSQLASLKQLILQQM